MRLAVVEPERITGIWNQALHEIGNFSVYVETPGMVAEIDADRVFSGASMIKSFLLHVTSHLVESGHLSWLEPVTVDDKHLASGDGVLRYWPWPQTMTLMQVCGLMIAVSDNTATNAIVDHLGGIHRVNDLIDEPRYEKSRLRGWVGGAHHDSRRDEWTASAGMHNEAGLSVVTAREHASCVKSLMASPVCAGMLLAQKDRSSLARHFTSDVQFAHKSGSVDGLRHDGGRLLLGGGDYLDVHVLTDGPVRDKVTDDPACIAMGQGMLATMEALGLR